MKNKFPSILDSKILIIKIGSSLLLKNDKFNSFWLENLSEEIEFLKRKKIQIILVVSGAVSLGKKFLKVKNNKKITIAEKQASAACGQSILMNFFKKIFDKKMINVAQILLTFSETEDRRKSLNARETIYTLLNSGVIPIINENDSIATEELKFGDNDRLAARVGQIVDADSLILLSDVQGLFDSNPLINKEAKFINIVKKIDQKIKNMGTSETNFYGSGGMKTKIEAAEIAVNFGCNTIICSGKINNPIKTLIDYNDNCGTWFIARKDKISHFKKWILSSVNISGKLVVDEGAFSALSNGSSLLPSGVKKITGNFLRGDIVEVVTTKDRLIGKGIVAYDSDESILIIGKRSSNISKVLGYEGREEIIHRDNFIMLKKN